MGNISWKLPRTNNLTTWSLGHLWRQSGVPVHSSHVPKVTCPLFRGRLSSQPQLAFNGSFLFVAADGLTKVFILSPELSCLMGGYSTKDFIVTKYLTFKRDSSSRWSSLYLSIRQQTLKPNYECHIKIKKSKFTCMQRNLQMIKKSQLDRR